MELYRFVDTQIEELLSKADSIKQTLDFKCLSIADYLNIEYVKAPVKQKQRAIEKVIVECNGDSNMLADIVRCSFLCKNYEQMISVLREIRQDFPITFVEDTMKSPKEKYDGYRRILVFIMIDDFLAEVQIMLDSVYNVKLDSRDLYLQKRQLFAQKELEKREFTKQEIKKLQKLKEESINLYDSAIKKFNLKTTGQKLKLHREVFR